METIAEAVAVLRGPLPGPAFIEIPHDLFLAPVSVGSVKARGAEFHFASGSAVSRDRRRSPTNCRQPHAQQFLLAPAFAMVQPLSASLPNFCNARSLPPPAGRECFPAIIRFRWAAFPVLAAVQEVFRKAICSFLLERVSPNSIPGASVCSFRHSTFRLLRTPSYAGDRIPSSKIVGKIAEIAQAFAQKRNEARSLVRYRRNQSKRITTAGSTGTG